MTQGYCALCRDPSISGQLLSENKVLRETTVQDSRSLDNETQAWFFQAQETILCHMNEGRALFSTCQKYRFSAKNWNFQLEMSVTMVR